MTAASDREFTVGGNGAGGTSADGGATSANGAHSLVSKAFDAANNTGTSATINVTVSNGTPINISGYKIVQANAALTYTIPAATTIPSKGYVVIGRNATKTAFQTF